MRGDGLKNNIQMLFEILNGHTKSVAKANRSGAGSLFGRIINTELKLEVDGIRGEIPANEYITVSGLTLESGDRVAVLRTEGKFVVLNTV